MTLASPDTSIAVNGRFRVHRITGVQRYAHEIVARLEGEVDLCTPRSARGVTGHLWEQSILPLASRGRLLWSPCGSGPLLYDRQVVTFHDLFPIEHAEWYGTAYAKWYGISMRRLAASAIHLIAVSEYTKARLVAVLGRDPEEITVIHNGCNTHGCASVSQIEAARRALSLPTHRYVLSLSSLEKRKNLSAILAAWSIVHPKLPADTWLVLAGPKADESIYGRQDAGADLPRVKFTGYVPDEHLAGLYSGASLFVFPSLAEGFGLPLLEAMACGVRCITSRTSSLPEVGGDVVDYVDPTNPSELAAAMMKQLQDQDTPLVPFEPAIQRARQFTWDSAASKTREVLTAAVLASRKSHKVYGERTEAI
jgi:glycosyltransferase involved in cell wall biosynthesis